MKAVLGLWIALLLVFVGVPAQALESFVLYDDFQVERIDANKWSSSTFGGGVPAEIVQQIDNGELHRFLRAYGQANSNTGLSGGTSSLTFKNSALVTAIKATVTFTQATTVSCPLNPEPTRVRLVISGSFFNTDSIAHDPGDFAHDVVADFRITRRSDTPPGMLRAAASVFQCQDRDCNDTIDYADLDLGLIELNKAMTLSMQHDVDNSRFIFTVGSATAVGSYPVAAVSPTSNPEKSIDLRVRVANCTAAPRPAGTIELLMDNVFVNASAASAVGR